MKAAIKRMTALMLTVTLCLTIMTSAFAAACTHQQKGYRAVNFNEENHTYQVETFCQDCGEVLGTSKTQTAEKIKNPATCVSPACYTYELSYTKSGKKVFSQIIYLGETIGTAVNSKNHELVYEVEIVNAGKHTYRIKTTCANADECGYDEKYTKTMTAEKVTKKATCSSAGESYYYISYTVKGVEVVSYYMDTQILSADKNAHQLKNGKCQLCGKKQQSMTAKASKTSLKYSKKKAQTVTVTVSKAKGKVTLTADEKDSKVTVKGTKITFAKGAKKGTYSFTVTAAGDKTYCAASKTITVKVK